MNPGTGQQALSNPFTFDAKNSGLSQMDGIAFPHFPFLSPLLTVSIWGCCWHQASSVCWEIGKQEVHGNGIKTA